MNPPRQTFQESFPKTSAASSVSSLSQPKFMVGSLGRASGRVHFERLMAVEHLGELDIKRLVAHAERYGKARLTAGSPGRR